MLWCVNYVLTHDSQRTKLWRRQGDGPVRAIHTGGNDEFRRWAWDKHIYASARIGQDSIRIALFHGTDTRTRTSLTMPGTDLPTLADNVLHAAVTPKVKTRFTQWPGGDMFTEGCKTLA